MVWQVHWEVIGGDSGSRTDPSPRRIYQHDRIRFVLHLTNDYQYALESAQTSGGWRGKPELVVTGSQNTQITTHSSEANPLVIEYTFNYEGVKNLRFIGRAQRFIDPTQRIHHRNSNGELERAALFPDLNIEHEIRVLPSLSRGEATATMAGSQSRSAQQQQTESEHRRTVANSLIRRQQHERESAINILDHEARQRRESTISGRGHLSTHGVLLGINLLESYEVSTRSIENVEEYMLRLQSSINVTPAIDIYSHPWENVRIQGYVPRTRVLKKRVVWEVSEHPYGIRKIRQYDYMYGAAISDGLDQRPLPPRAEVLETIRLRSTDWMVVRLTQGGPKSLIPAESVMQSIRTERLLELASAVVSLASLAVDVATSPEALAFSILANTFFPEELNMAIGIATMSISIVRSLAGMLTRVLRSTGRLTALNNALLRRQVRNIRGSPTPSLHEPNPRGVSSLIDDAERGLVPNPAASGHSVPQEQPAPRSSTVSGLPNELRPPSPVSSTGTAIVRRIEDISQARIRLQEMHDTGLSHTQISILSRLINIPFSSELESLGSYWRKAMGRQGPDINRIQRMFADGATMSMTQSSARSVFGTIRNNFWRSVYLDGTWTQTFAAAGIRLKSRGRSPYIILHTPNGRRTVTIDIGHEDELSQHVMSAFSSRNLSLQFQGENRILLNQAMSQDPFIPDARLVSGSRLNRAGRLRFGLQEYPAGTTGTDRPYGYLLPPPGGNPEPSPSELYSEYDPNDFN